jgi:DNA polymerase V
MKEKKPARGGRREGSGRPAGSSKSGEPTKVIRVPEGAQAQVLDFIAAYKLRQTEEPAQSRSFATSAHLEPHSEPRAEPRAGPRAGPLFPDDVEFPMVDAPAFDLPLYAYAVPAGLPAAAEDTVERRLDLNRFLIRNPASTFYFRVSGDSMNQAGILDGMTAAVDCSKLPRNREPVLALVNGEFTVKRYVKAKNGFELHPDSDNPIHQPIVGSREQPIEVRGVIVGTIQKFN